MSRTVPLETLTWDAYMFGVEIPHPDHMCVNTNSTVSMDSSRRESRASLTDNSSACMCRAGTTESMSRDERTSVQHVRTLLGPHSVPSAG